MSKMNARRLLGRQLQYARERADITRDELAAALEENVIVIKNWELGRTRIPAERLVAIAAACKTTVTLLLEHQPQLAKAA